MALINDAKKEINVKIVYLGPKGAGKSTALHFIYNSLQPDCRSELKSLASGEHQMLFFDFSYPVPRRSDGYTFRFHIYTLVSSGTATPPWKMLLKGADGVVLFADATREKMYGNLECCTLLFASLDHYGLKLGDITLSLQGNKTDLTGAVPLAALKDELLPELDAEPVPVTANTGDGLLAGLNSTITAIMRKLGADGPGPLAAKTDAPAAPAAAAATEDDDSSFLHCTAVGSGFEVEVAGTPRAAGTNTVVIPLRLKGSECGKSIDFKVTVSVTL